MTLQHTCMTLQHCSSIIINRYH